MRTRDGETTLSWLTALAWLGGAAVIVAAAYGLHQLGLWLEERGYVYYWHKQSTASASRMWTPLQEIVEPQVTHVVEATEHHRADADDREGDPERPASWRDRRTFPR